MTKSESPKPPTKLQTITLKVYIHCEGCRRKVRRIIRVVDGVEDVTVDSASSKVTVTGTADVKTILERLRKYGKQAEVWPSSNAAPPVVSKAGANQPKPSSNNTADSNTKKKSNGGSEGEGKAGTAASESGSGKGNGKEAAVSESKSPKSKETKPEEADDTKSPVQQGGGGGGGGGKKGGKKGGNGGSTNGSGNSNNGSGGGNGNVSEVPSLGPPAYDNPNLSAPVVVSANRNLAAHDSIQTGYANQSADYATHMFSDENANNCSIM